MKIANRIIIVTLACMALLVPNAQSAESPESMTIETGGKALILHADASILKQIRENPEVKVSPDAGIDQLIEKLEDEYGDKIEIETFATPRMENFSDMDKLIIGVREATLRGMLPPIEGLDIERAVALLEAFGFSVFTYSEVDNMSRQKRVRMLFMAEGAVVVLSGTDPFSDMTIYKEKKRNMK